MRWAVAVLAFLLCALGAAQTREFVGGHLTTPPILDGKVEPDEYKDAVRLEGLVDSQSGGPAPEGGTFYLGYDAKFVYFAAKLVDAQPSAIQATEFRTNVSLQGNDTVTLLLDPFGKLVDFNGFTMNARGGTSLDIAGGRAAKREWLGDFVSKGRVTAEGWEVEARIPWSVLRLPGKGPHDLRFNVYRNHRRLHRNFSWAYTNNGLQQNFGRWKAVDLPAGEPPLLQALPYVYAGADGKKGLVANSGIDLRYPLTHELDLVGTINPDFRNVERGIQSIDFSYFEQLPDETRPFFLEGRDYFGGDDSPIFTPQRILNLDAGAKMFGKLDPKTDVGVLATSDFDQNDAVVGRVHRQTGDRSYWSAAYAGGDVQGKRNDAVSASAGIGGGSWDYNASFSGTQDETQGAGYKANVAANYGHQRAYAYVGYGETTKDFLPGLGYAPQTDWRGFDSFLSESWNYHQKGIQEYRTAGYFAYQRSYDLSRPYLEDAEFFPSLTLNDGTVFRLNLGHSRYFGGTGDQTYGFSLERPVGDPYRHWGMHYEAGTRAGSYYRDASVGFSYRPLPTLQVNASYETTTYVGDTFNQTILSANYDLDQYHSIGTRALVSPHGTNYYVSFRQAGNRGAEYYLIFGDPNSDTFRASLVLKAVFPVSVKL